MELPRHHCAWAPGGMGGFAEGLPPDPAVRVVDLARRTRASVEAEPLYDDNNHTLLRRMRLHRDSLRMHSRTDSDASLSLSRLPAIQRRSVFVFCHRADGSFQALARLTTLPCLAQ